MMMSLDYFIFNLNTVPYQSQQRSTAQRLQQHIAIGSAVNYQNLGVGEDKQTLSGILYPAITGGPDSLDELRNMQDAGEAYILIDGQGNVLGEWFIESVESTSTEFFKDGAPQKIEFTLTLLNSHTYAASA